MPNFKDLLQDNFSLRSRDGYFTESLKSKGFGIIEILVAGAIISVALVSLTALGNFVLRTQSYLKQNLIAANLATEAMEAAKAVKDEDWSLFGALITGNSYYPTKTGSPQKWSLVAGEETIGGFSRRIVLSEVQRNSDDDIVESGGIPDQGTRKVSVVVSWSERQNTYQVNLESYLANWKP